MFVLILLCLQFWHNEELIHVLSDCVMKLDYQQTFFLNHSNFVRLIARIVEQGMLHSLTSDLGLCRIRHYELSSSPSVQCKSLNCATLQPKLLKRNMWCRRSEIPSIIAVREYNLSRLSTQDMKTRAVCLHVKSQVQLGLVQVKVKLAMFGG